MQTFQQLAVISCIGMALGIGWTVGIQLLDSMTAIVCWLIRKFIR